MFQGTTLEQVQLEGVKPQILNWESFPTGNPKAQSTVNLLDQSWDNFGFLSNNQIPNTFDTTFVVNVSRGQAATLETHMPQTRPTTSTTESTGLVKIPHVRFAEAINPEPTTTVTATRNDTGFSRVPSFNPPLRLTTQQSQPQPSKAARHNPWT